MSFFIVKAESTDYSGFIDIFKEVEEFHRLNAPWKFKKPELELFSKTLFNDIIANDKARFLLAKDKNIIVGFIIGYIKESQAIPTLKPRKWIDIDNLAVSSLYREQKIGITLLNKIEEWAHDCDIEEIELNVWDFNKGAIKFYEKGGYEFYSHRMRKIIK